MKIAISLRHIHKWFDGAIAPAIEVAQRAEEAGMEQVSVVDHILMSEDLSGYPYGKAQFEADYPWWEPVTLLGAFSSVTKRIRLATSVIVSPVRPAVFLAKQLATLDHLSNGRVDAGLGVGWQKAEYDSTGVPWENRFARMEEQIRAMKILWSQAPATYHGNTLSFDRIHQRPFPLQARGVPIWLGVSDSERSLARVADLGDGWSPPFNDPDKLAPAIERLRSEFKARDRDPDHLQVRAVNPIMMGKNGPDLDLSLKHMEKYRSIGVTMMEIPPAVFCEDIKEYDGFLKAVNSARGV